MEHSPSWEANSSSSRQEIPRILWNPMVRHRIHKSSPPVPILNHINTFSQFLQMHSNSIVPSMPWSSSFLIPLLNQRFLYDYILICERRILQLVTTKD